MLFFPPHEAERKADGRPHWWVMSGDDVSCLKCKIPIGVLQVGGECWRLDTTKSIEQTEQS